MTNARQSITATSRGSGATFIRKRWPDLSTAYGLQSQFGRAIPALFAKTVLAQPRIYVRNPSATHFSYVTGMGAEIEQTREAALLADPALPEPLTNRIATNPAAARAYRLVEHGADPLRDSWPRHRQRAQLLQPSRRELNSFTRRESPGRVHRFSAVPVDRCIHAEAGDPERLLVPESRCIPLHSGRHSWKATIAICGISRLVTFEATVWTQRSSDRLAAGRFLTIARSREALRSPTGRVLVRPSISRRSRGLRRDGLPFTAVAGTGSGAAGVHVDGPTPTDQRWSTGSHRAIARSSRLPNEHDESVESLFEDNQTLRGTGSAEFDK